MDLPFLQKLAALIRTASYRFQVKCYRHGNMEKPSLVLLIAFRQPIEWPHVLWRLREHT